MSNAPELNESQVEAMVARLIGDVPRSIDDQAILNRVCAGLAKTYMGDRAASVEKDQAVARALAAYDTFTVALRDMEGTVEGDVLEHLQSVDQHGVHEGEWLSDPVAVAASDPNHGPFGTTVQGAKGMDLRVSVCIDGSGSMTTIHGLGFGYEYEKDGLINEVGKKFPLFLAPLALFATVCGRGIVKTLQRVSSTTGVPITPAMYWWALGSSGSTIKEWNGDVYFSPPNAGSSTEVEPLLKRLEKDEAAFGGTGAARLDLLVTDGYVYDLYTDPVREIQTRRSSGAGTLRTIIIRVLPPDDITGNVDRFDANKLPVNCYEMRVSTPQELRSAMQKWTTEFLMS